MKFPSEEKLTPEYREYLRQRKVKTAPLERSDSADVVEQTEPDAPAVLRAESVSAMPARVSHATIEPLWESVVDESLAVKTGERIFDTLDEVIEHLMQSSTVQPNTLATFARARLRALLMDPQVRDPQLVAAAKALLRNNPESMIDATESESIFTVFATPHNNRGPLPRGKVFFVRDAWC